MWDLTLLSQFLGMNYRTLANIYWVKFYQIFTRSEFSIWNLKYWNNLVL
jgi:hypothetical protein